MNTKLTLSIEKSIIEQAKNYAKSKNRSLSDIIENYLKLLTDKEKLSVADEANPIVESLRGSFKMSPHVDYNTALQERREKKYLKNE